jgi:hypothetical protein
MEIVIRNVHLALARHLSSAYHVAVFISQFQMGLVLIAFLGFMTLVHIVLLAQYNARAAL